MESSSIGAGNVAKSKDQKTSSDIRKTQESHENLPSDKQLTPSPHICSNKENINNSAHQTSDPDYNKDGGITHYQHFSSTYCNRDAPVNDQEENVHAKVQLEHCNVQNSAHSAKNGDSFINPQGDNVITTSTNSKECLAFGANSCGDTKAVHSSPRVMPIVKIENVCDEPAIYNDIAIDPVASDQNNNTPDSVGHPAGSITTEPQCSKKNTVIQNNQQEKPGAENAQILLVYIEENSSGSTKQVIDKPEAKQITTTASTYNPVEGVIVKNEQPAGAFLNKPCIIKQEVMDTTPSCDLDNAQAKEYHGQMEISATNENTGNVVSDRNAANGGPSAASVATTNPMACVEPTCENRQATSGQQVVYTPGTNQPSESNVFKDPNKHLREPQFEGTGRQVGESSMMVSDHNSNRIGKSETVISQFNMFPTEKDVMAAVYQNTAETSHLTSNGGFMNAQSTSTSVVSTHGGCTSYIPNDLQPSSSYPESQGSHSKWFANQVNLAAALCVANNSNYQDVQGSSPLIPQRSPQQRNMLSPSYQKDFSQFVLQSPKSNVHSNQTISPSMLCSPSTNLFDTLMYQSENPFSPPGSRSDTSRSYSSVQDLDELMSAHHMQQSAYQSRQASCYMSSSVHPDSQQSNRSQDMNWNGINQPTSLPGVGSLLPSNQARPNSGNASQTAYNARDRFVGNSALSNMGNVAVENVRQQKDVSGMVMEEYTATQYQEMLQKHEPGQIEDNRNWNAVPQEEQECRSQQKQRPRKQNVGESNSAPHLAGKQPVAGGKTMKRSVSNTETSCSTPAKKTCETPPEEDSKGYVNYQIASTIHTLKPRHIVSWYIDFLIKENENITDMSHSYSIPAGIFDDRDFYFMESFLKRMTFPTKKFANWMQANFPSININAIDFSEGRRKAPQNYIIDEAKYWSERTQVDIINEVFYHFQTARDQK